MAAAEIQLGVSEDNVGEFARSGLMRRLEIVCVPLVSVYA